MEIGKWYQFKEDKIFRRSAGSPTLASFLPFKVVRVASNAVAIQFEHGDYEVLTLNLDKTVTWGNIDYSLDKSFEEIQKAKV